VINTVRNHELLVVKENCGRNLDKSLILACIFFNFNIVVVLKPIMHLSSLILVTANSLVTALIMYLVAGSVLGICLLSVLHIKIHISSNVVCG
jgi:hypothetical protein